MQLSKPDVSGVPDWARSADSGENVQKRLDTDDVGHGGRAGARANWSTPGAGIGRTGEVLALLLTGFSFPFLRSLAIDDDNDDGDEDDSAHSILAEATTPATTAHRPAHAASHPILHEAPAPAPVAKMMPFDAYLQDVEDSVRRPSSSASAYNPHTFSSTHASAAVAAASAPSNPAFPGEMKFHLPPFLDDGARLAEGGGGEAFPPSAMANFSTLWYSTHIYPSRQMTEIDPMSLSKPFTPSDFIVQESYPLDERASSTPTSNNTSDSALASTSNPTSPTFPINPSALSSSTSISGDSSSAYQLSTLSAHTSVSPVAQSLVSIQQQAPNPPPPNAPAPPLGLPVYSASGFDFLSILARVANRSHPSIVLGPVDLTCSFTVVDTRRWDRPIVYASPTFFKLTGYEEHEVIGRNCRFLQSPTGEIQPGEVRKFTSQDAVTHLRKSLQADKECQASLVNFKKGGKAFINLVTVIPIAGGVNNGPDEQDDYVYQVGFQVDLTDQPNAILQRLRDGSYIVNYSTGSGPGSIPALALRDRKMHGGHHGSRSKELQGLLADPKFLATIPITSELASSNGGSNATSTADSGNSGKQSDTVSSSHEGSQPLSLILLEKLPDFILVLSLKGAFLYVAPSVRAVLGYEPSDLVGTLISDYCHAADVVPVMRELKDSSSAIPSSSAVAADGSNASSIAPVGLHAIPPRTVDILFRMRAKNGAYVWVECRGRLHIEPGKGRKAIILSARARGVPSISWDRVALAGGLATSAHSQGQQPQQQGQGQAGACKETWLSVDSREGRVLSADRKAEELLGYTDRELIGRRLAELVIDDMHRGHLTQAMRDAVEEYGTGAGPPPMPPPKTVACTLRDKQGREVGVRMVMYTSPPSPATSPTPVPLVVQVRANDVPVSTAALPCGSGGNGNASDVFAEMDVSRSTSWIYELQQVKLENQRLAEEVERLEASSSSSSTTATGAAATSSTTPSLSPTSTSSSGMSTSAFAPQSQGAEATTGYAAAISAAMQDVQPTYISSADQYTPHSPLDDVHSVSREWVEYEAAAQSRAMMQTRLPLGQKRSWDEHRA